MQARFLIAGAALSLLCACDAPLQLPDTEELEAELRADPGRPGKVGAIVAVGVLQQAARVGTAIRGLPAASCALPIAPGHRWIGELNLRRSRQQQILVRWTETRSLDRDDRGNLALRSSASYRSELGAEGARDVEWRIVGSDAWISTPGSDGDLWARRAAEEDEPERIRASADGTLQALVDAVGGWSANGPGWTQGTQQLQCSTHDEGPAFIERFTATARIQAASLRGTERGRTLDATWILEDGSTLHAEYEDRVVPLTDLVTAPESNIVPIERERSLFRAEQLLTKLAADGLAEVASPRPEESPEP